MALFRYPNRKTWWLRVSIRGPGRPRIGQDPLEDDGHHAQQWRLERVGDGEGTAGGAGDVPRADGA